MFRVINLPVIVARDMYHKFKCIIFYYHSVHYFLCFCSNLFSCLLLSSDHLEVYCLIPQHKRNFHCLFTTEMYHKSYLIRKYILFSFSPFLFLSLYSVFYYTFEIIVSKGISTDVNI